MSYSQRIPVSVIIPCYKSAGVIGRTLDSILGQTRPPEEVILVDDGNDEAFYEVVDQFCRRQPPFELMVLKNPRNIGPSASRNRGWDVAQGEFVAFLDHDDAWHPRKLEWQFDRMKKDDHPVLSAHRSICVEEGHDGADWKGDLKEWPISRDRLVFSNFFSTPTVMVLRSLELRFDARMKYAEDYDLWLRILFQGHHGVFLDAPLTFLFKARYGAGGLSSHLWRMEKGVQTAFSKLYRSGSISSVRHAVIRIYSGLKFCRRLAIRMVLPQKSH